MVHGDGEGEEDKLVWKEPDGQIRSLYGTITEENDREVTITRRDGTWTIARQLILKIRRRGRR